MEAEKIKVIEKLTGIRSSRKNYYVELQQQIDEVSLRIRQLEIINRIAKSFNLDMPVEKIINCLVQKLPDVVPVDELKLSIFIEGECKVFDGNCGDGSCNTCSCIPDGICRYIIKNQKSLVFPDEAKNLGQMVSLELLNGSGVYVPLMVKKRVIGILTIKSNTKRAYSQQDVAFLEQLAEHLSIGLNNIKLFSDILQRERELEDTFRAVTDAVLTINTDYQIIRVNRQAKEIFQLDSIDTRQKKCFEIIHQRTKPCEICPMLAGASDLKRSYQFYETNKEVYDLYTYPMFAQNGRLAGVFESFKDVTQQMAIEKQLVHSEKLAAIGKLAAGVAHELNNPLTAILGNAQLLQREIPVESDNAELMEDIKQCGIRCKNIIRNLLTFARHQKLESEAISINEVLDRAIGLVGHQIRQEQIELVYEQESQLPAITGSIQELEQVVINLLVNAKDALENREEKKIIGVTSGRCQKNGLDCLYISVEDNGCGMAGGQLEEIFTPFYTTKEVGKGTGLGLAVSLGIVQNHGGSIECESAPGEGSKFTVILPVNKGYEVKG